jgi:hypothetical protein
VVTRTRKYYHEKYDHGTAHAVLRTVEQIQWTTYRLRSSSDIPLVSAAGPSMRSSGGASLSRPRGFGQPVTTGTGTEARQAGHEAVAQARSRPRALGEPVRREAVHVVPALVGRLAQDAVQRRHDDPQAAGVAARPRGMEGGCAWQGTRS